MTVIVENASNSKEKKEVRGGNGQSVRPSQDYLETIAVS